MFLWFYTKFLRIFFGELKPEPERSIIISVTLLKFFGLWKCEDDNLLKKIWSISNRAVFLYIYVVTQVLYFLKVEDVKVSVLNFKSANQPV